MVSIAHFPGVQPDGGCWCTGFPAPSSIDDFSSTCSVSSSRLRVLQETWLLEPTGKDNSNLKSEIEKLVTWRYWRVCMLKIGHFSLFYL